MIFVVLYFLVALICATICSCAIYADTYEGIKSISRRIVMTRQDAGFSILLGLCSGMVWPIGIVIVFLLTGFFTHGLMIPGSKR